IETFTDARRFSPDMEEILRKVQVRPGGNELDVVKATAVLTDGRTVDEECRWFRGSVGNPMSRDERLAKFSGCARRVLSEQDTTLLFDQLERLEQVDDVSPIMAMLCLRPQGAA
ncbi:MAG: hypothetical protein V3S37_04390, partial [Dehalococcoidia bacterium]